LFQPLRCRCHYAIISLAPLHYAIDDGWPLTLLIIDFRHYATLSIRHFDFADIIALIIIDDYIS